MFTRKLALPILCFTILLSACSKEEEFFTTPTEINDNTTNDGAVASAFAPYIERFIAEGAARGFNIDLEERNITILFTNIDQSESPNVVGMCTYNSHVTGDITIDAAFWEQSSDLMREFILFHELGHCYLHRAHRSGALQNGMCISIMRGAEPGCTDAYTPANRDYYINELFSITGDIFS